MKKRGLILFTMMLMIILLTACGGKTVKLSDYLEVSFSGKDTVGVADYHLNTSEMIEDLFGIKPEEYESEMSKLMEKNPKKVEEIGNVLNGYYFETEQEQDLSNGDTFVIELGVREEASKLLKGSKEEIKVEGLEELKELTSEEVKKHVVVDFTGASGQGKARIENTLSDGLSSIDFTVENQGELSNGDKAVLTIDEESKAGLIHKGYKLADDFSVTYDVTGLDVYAAKGQDINNLADIERMIDEQMKKNFGQKPTNEYSRRYVYEENVQLYRQFGEENDFSGNNGSFLKLFTVTEYNNKEAFDKKDEDRSYVYVIGYDGLLLDDKNNVNVSKMSLITETKDSSYSLETIQQIYEGNGYEIVAPKK